MINFDDVAKENIKDYNLNWPQIPDLPYQILITGCSGSGKANSLFNLLGCLPHINKIYLCGKDPHAAKYQFLINKCEGSGLKHFSNSKVKIYLYAKDPYDAKYQSLINNHEGSGLKIFMAYSNDINDIYENIEETKY